MKIIFNLLLFIVFFILFAWDMEHTRSFATWIYLLVAIINFAIVFIFWTAEIILTVLKGYFTEK